MIESTKRATGTENGRGTAWRGPRAVGVGAFAGLLLVGGALVAQTVAAQESEDCNCEWPRVFSYNGFSLFGDRPMLGISLDMGIDRELEETGVRISDVLEDGPADEAGVQAGDVVVSLDGHDLTEPLDDPTERGFDDVRSFPGQRLTAIARDLDEGEPVEMVVLRDGERMTLTVTPEELDAARIVGNVLPEVTDRLAHLRTELNGMDWFHWDDDDLGEMAPRIHVGGDAPFVRVWGGVRGLELVELNEGLGSYFGTDRGVLVADVDEDSPFAFQPGDVVLEIDGRAVESPAHFRRILASYLDDETVQFRIMRNGQEMEISGQVR